MDADSVVHCCCLHDLLGFCYQWQCFAQFHFQIHSEQKLALDTFGRNTSLNLDIKIKRHLRDIQTLLPKIALLMLIKDVIPLIQIIQHLLSMKANINIILVMVVGIVSLNEVWIVIKIHIYIYIFKSVYTESNANVVKTRSK